MGVNPLFTTTMYMIDANVFMNVVLGIILGTGALLFALTLFLGVLGKPTGRKRSYLYMFTGLFGVFGIIVGVLGFRGQKSENRPWHFFLDMKYQPKYTSQGQSRFFADGRSNRLPPEGTIPFDGTDYFADAGYHGAPNTEFLRADRRYFFGIANEDKTTVIEGVKVPKPPEWKGGKLVGEGYWVNHIPELAVTDAGGWKQLIERGRQQFNVHCSACHGTSGRGGVGDAAFGTVGLYGLDKIPANLVADIVQAQPDGQLFGTITNGVRTMPAYAHQVKVHDRWAIVAYIRVLQYAAEKK